MQQHKLNERCVAPGARQQSQHCQRAGMRQQTRCSRVAGGYCTTLGLLNPLSVKSEMLASVYKVPPPRC